MVEKSTSEIELIAQRTVEQQAKVCDVHRDSLNDKLHALSDLAQANMKAIAEVTKALAVMAETIRPLPVSVKENDQRMDGIEDDLAKLKWRPAFLALLGSALPVAAGILWELAHKSP